MRVRVAVYLRPRAVKQLLARGMVQAGAQRWLAKRIGVSESHMSNLLAGRFPLKPDHQSAVLEAIASRHQRGVRATWDALFHMVTIESGAAK